MRTYIRKLQSKKVETRKQIFAGVMVISMSFVALIWVYSLGVRFGNPVVKEKANEDIKPFKLFGDSISNTYKNISASVGKAPTTEKVIKEEVDTKLEKQIDLIPVEYSNQ